MWELLIIAVGLSMDAFAIAICKGLSVERAEPKHLLSAGLWFGGAQAVMPLLGYLLGSGFQSAVDHVDHWIAFVLLVFIGINMIRESREENEEELDALFTFRAMLPLAIATSIDALAVGITFAFLNVDIVPAVSFIGIITFLLSSLGVWVGSVFGSRFKQKAELSGGLILIFMGTKILLEHLGIL